VCCCCSAAAVTVAAAAVAAAATVAAVFDVSVGMVDEVFSFLAGRIEHSFRELLDTGEYLWQCLWGLIV
jgi:hypothetical protein